MLYNHDRRLAATRSGRNDHGCQLTAAVPRRRGRYKKAQTPEEKLAALKKMWVILPKHKASEKVQADLKTKISELNDEIEHAKTAPKKAAPALQDPPAGGRADRVARAAQRRQERLLAKADEGDAGSGTVSVHHAGAGARHDGLGGRSRATHRPAADHAPSSTSLHYRNHSRGRCRAPVPRLGRRRWPRRDASRHRTPQAGPPRTGAARTAHRRTIPRFTPCRRCWSRTSATTRARTFGWRLPGK